MSWVGEAGPSQSSPPPFPPSVTHPAPKLFSPAIPASPRCFPFHGPACASSAPMTSSAARPTSGALLWEMKCVKRTGSVRKQLVLLRPPASDKENDALYFNLKVTLELPSQQGYMRKDWILVSSSWTENVGDKHGKCPNKEKVSLLPLQNFINTPPPQIYEKCHYPLISSCVTSDMMLSKTVHCKTGRHVKLIKVNLSMWDITQVQMRSVAPKLDKRNLICCISYWQCQLRLKAKTPKLHSCTLSLGCWTYGNWIY